MKFKVLTLFPEMFTSYFSSSIMKRAIGKGLIDVQFINIRDYTKNKYNRCDNKPVGGGAGLIMQVQPIIDCLKNVSTPSTHKIILTPRGKTYNQEKAKELAKNYDEILILCGHYEGVDERVYQYFDEEISIGDYILTGGEAAAICLIDSISRLIKGVITEESIDIESFDNNLLEYPQFTEPYEFDNKKIPDILYSGNLFGTLTKTLPDFISIYTFFLFPLSISYSNIFHLLFRNCFTNQITYFCRIFNL